ncbi:MAG: hypothetical protein FWG03_11170, partial [Clostridiales bacterium]|nr:hypothetical protein [Clostridiales bacterium]
LASYGGAASIQQGSARLVMNGGLVSGNSARTANTQGIVVNKGDASFEMNGGVINNGAHGVHLYESGTNGTLTLNAGRVSGVTVDNNISFGKNTQRRLFLKQGVVIDTGYASVAGRQVWPVSADYHIGNPNFANYGGIMAALPQGWSMPANAGNVIGFWMKKGGTAVFSVPAPTAGAPPDNYDRGLGVYFAAVQGTLDSGAADASSKVRFYPAVLENGRIKVSLPLKAYANGATVVLVQPSEEYGVIEFQGPEMLPYDPKATGYNIYYTATYEMPENLQALLDTDGHSNANTVFNLVIRPDGLTAPDIASLTVSSDLFETGGPAVWDDQAWELTVPLVLKDGWGAATDLVTDFTFTCGMDAGDFFDGGVLSLTGHMVIDGENGAGDKKIYYILGNTVNTEMLIPEVGTDGEETIVETVEGLAGGEGLSAGAAAGDIAITPPPPGTADGGKKAWGVPLTGDKFSLGLWLAGLALGLLGLIGAHMARSKAKQR